MAHPHVDKQNIPSSANDRFILLLMVILTAGFMVVEFFIGIIANSLALISDAGHMLNDVFSLVLTYVALIIALRPPSSTFTFGFLRSEVITGFLNGISLLAVAGYILFEAVQRSLSLSQLRIDGMLVLVTAVIGLLINIIGIVLLHRDHFKSVNIQAAYSHILADAMGSIGAIVTGIGIVLFQAYWLDLVTSVVIGVLVVRAGINVTQKSARILLEAVPEGADPDKLIQEMELIEGVVTVCDFHVWKISQEHDMLTAHIVIDEEKDAPVIVAECKQVAKKHGFKHLTIQTEFVACKENDPEFLL